MLNLSLILIKLIHGLFFVICFNYYRTDSCQPQVTRIQIDYNHEKALAILKGNFNNTPISGIIRFTQPLPSDPVRIQMNITGLPKGQGELKHGLHIHAFGTSIATDDIALSCGSSGAHFDPQNVTHGDLKSNNRHLGDYGNVVSDNNGNIIYTFLDNVTTLYGPTSIIGRNIVLHQLEDDLGLKDNIGSRTIGNSGMRIACGIIGIGNF